MAEWEIQMATDAHALELAGQMRSADAAEVKASGGYEPLEALRASLAASPKAWTLFLAGRPAAMWGLCPTPRPDTAIAWLLTGDSVDRYRRTFFRLSREVLEEMLAMYPVLLNAVDARYEAALRWSRRLGAEVLPAIPFGAEGRSFHPVVFRRTRG